MYAEISSKDKGAESTSKWSEGGRNLAFLQKMCWVCVVHVPPQPFPVDVFDVGTYSCLFSPPEDYGSFHGIKDPTSSFVPHWHLKRRTRMCGRTMAVPQRCDKVLLPATKNALVSTDVNMEL
jgi:hypothetical protein